MHGGSEHLEISLAQAFELQALHTDRYLEQTERVIQTDDFPDHRHHA